MFWLHCLWSLNKLILLIVYEIVFILYQDHFLAGENAQRQHLAGIRYARSHSL